MSEAIRTGRMPEGVDYPPIDSGGPAYPQNFLMHDNEVISSGNLTAAGFQGLSLRDWFAAHALASFARGNDHTYAAMRAYEMADAMLLARKEATAHGDD